MFTLLDWRVSACSMTLAIGLSPAVAQPRPDPLDARAQVPPLEHRSTLAGYRRMAAAEPGDWREANDTVARIGGWRSYLREAARPEPSRP